MGFCPLGFCSVGVLSVGDLFSWGFVRLGFRPMGFCPLGFCLLGFCPLGFCLLGFCPLGFCLLGFCPRTDYNRAAEHRKCPVESGLWFEVADRAGLDCHCCLPQCPLPKRQSLSRLPSLRGCHLLWELTAT